jgi:outer membrane protein
MQIKRFKQDAANFQSQAQTVRLGHNKKRTEKREQQLSYATSIIAAVATRMENRNGHISKRIKKFIKAYKRKRIFLYLRYG